MRLDRTLAGIALTALATLHLPQLAHLPSPDAPTAFAESGGEGGEGGEGGGGSNSGSGGGGEGGEGGNSGSGSSGSSGGEGGEGAEGGEGGESGDDGGEGGSDDDVSDNGDDDTVAAPVTVETAEASFTRPDGRGDVVPDEILVMVDSRAALPGNLLDGGFRVVETRSLSALGLQVTRLRIPRDLSPAAARDLLLRRYPGLIVDLHQLYRPAAGEPLTAPDGAMRQIGWSADLAACAGPVAVGMIDTAIDDTTRAGMGGRLVSMRFADAGGPSDHGGAIASLLAGGRAGPVPALLPSGRLFAADVFGPGTGRPLGSVVAVAAALDWLAGQGVPVAGISLEGASSDVLALAVARAAGRGLVLVAAAGNGGPDAPPAYPAALPDVVAVSAVDGVGAPYAAGNRGDYVDVAAPGVGLWVNDGAGGGLRVSGTSYAVPFVAAALAVEARHTRIDPDSAVALLAARALDLGPAGRDPIYGAGLLQAPQSC